MIHLDPELARIAKSIASQSHSQATRHTDSDDNAETGDTAETVQVTVKWQSHPLDNAKKDVETVYKMNRVCFYSKSTSKIFLTSF